MNFKIVIDKLQDDSFFKSKPSAKRIRDGKAVPHPIAQKMMIDYLVKLSK